MKKHFIDFEIGLSDSELIFYKKEGENLIIKVLLWNDSFLNMVFHDVVRVLDNDINSISSFCEVIEENVFLREALCRLYEEKIPENHPYRHYQFLDDDDQIALEIACESNEYYFTTNQ